MSRIFRSGRRLALGVTLALTSVGATVMLTEPLPPLSRIASLSPVMTGREDKILFVGLSADDKWRMQANPSTVDPRYLRFLQVIEDKRFFYHNGVDPVAGLRAVAQLVTQGRVVSGASTLSMQAARLLDPRPRNVGGKLTQIAQALWLERHVGKPGILSIYLTLAPYGGNIEGVEAASLAYFNHDAAHLSVAEAALLVALPRSPEAFRPDRHPMAAHRARDAVLDRLHDAGAIDDEAWQTAKSEPIPTALQPRPQAVWHLAQRLIHDGAVGQMKTTLDETLQGRLEDWVGGRQLNLDPHVTLAVMVVDHRSRAVLAYIGSGAPHDSDRRGYNDMVRAVRSPGSALKPFIYGVGFDSGLIAPETFIGDEPVRFGAYTPKNFDQNFHGDVTVRTALQQSLNIPAIAVLSRVGPGYFTRLLEGIGVRLALPLGTEQPGLPIAIGGVGITMEDMTALYAALADQGRFAPLRFQAETGQGAPIGSIMSPRAAWYVTKILQDAPRPARYGGSTLGADTRPIAYKTGTSYGYRDAWALGYDPNYVIAVWVGRADGSPMPGRVARETAAPLLFDLFGMMPKPAKDQTMAGSFTAAPDDAEWVANPDLPRALQRLSPLAPIVSDAALQDNAPAITFPPKGATVEIAAADGDNAIVLQSKGGKLPLIWTVNGVVTARGNQRQLTWIPAGLGQTKVQITDRDGRTDEASIWVQEAK